MIRVEKMGETTYSVNSTEISVINGKIPEDAKEFLLDDEIAALDDFIKAEQRRGVQSTIK